MMSNSSSVSHIVSRIRGVARVWSALVFILALILVIGTRFAPTTIRGNTPFDILIPFSLLISMIGLGIAWCWEGWGALINILFYLAVVPIYWLLHREWIDLSVMVGLSPVILPGVLFGVAWFLSRNNPPEI
jgi:hypothetical protein